MNLPYSITQRLLSIGGLLSLFLITSCGDDDGGGDPAPITDPTVIDTRISEELILTNVFEDENLPDYIIDGFLTVNADLIIEPGVCVVFTANSGLYIDGDGTIQAIGTASEPIKFTGETKTTGYWKGIQVRANDVRNELNYVTVEYAGSDYLATYGTAIKIFGGVAIEGASGSNGSLKVLNSTIQNCTGYGLIVEQGTNLREFSNNTFNGNTEAAVRIDADNAGAIDGASTFSQNGIDGVEINASGSPTHALTADDTWQALSNGAMYVVEQSFDAIATLTIMPGTNIAFEANQTIIFRQDYSGPNDGIIIAKGTASNPITFTGVAKTAGYWRGIIVQSDIVTNEMDYCIVEYGGSDEVAGGFGNVILDKDGAYNPPKLIVTNSTIRNSAGCGILKDTFGAELTSSGNTYTDNAGSDVCN